MDTPTVKKETKKRLVVDYEGKLSAKERFLKKIKTSNTWIKAAINFFRFVLMLGVSFVILYPFFARVTNSFMTRADIADPTVSLVPKHFTTEIYRAIIVENHYFEALWHTALLSLLCALVQTLIACLIGYGLAKFKFKGNKLMMGVVVLTMIIPHRALQFAMMRHFNKFDLFSILTFGVKGPIELITGSSIDLLNSFWPLIILSVTGLAFKNGLYIYMMRQFFKGVPDELEESAYVDGAGIFRTFFQIIIPLSIPMMITIFLFSFSWQWTDEFYTKLFWTNQKFYLMPQLYEVIPDSLVIHDSVETLYKNVFQNTAGLMIILPLVILYLFCQRYLVQGIERSGLVG